MSDSYANRLHSLTLTSLAHFINDGTTFLVPLIVDYISLDKSVPPIWITVILVVFYASSTVLSTFVGRLADKTGAPGTLISVGLGLLSLGLLGFYAAVSQFRGLQQLGLSTLFSAVTGFGSAFYHPLGASVIQSSFGDERKGRALGVNGAMGSLGRTLYPGLYFVLAAFLTKPGTFAFFGLVGLAAAAAMFQGFRGERARIHRQKDWSNGAPTSSVTRGIILLSAIGLLRSAATQGVISWIPIYFTHTRNLGFTSSLGATLTLMYAAGIVGQLFFGFMVENFEKRRVLALSFVGSSLSLLGFLYLEGYLLYASLFGFGFFVFTAFPLFLSLATDYAPRESSSLGGALVWGVGMGIGGVVGPLLPPIIAPGGYAHLSQAFLVLAILNLAVALLLPALPKPKKASKVNMFG